MAFPLPFHDLSLGKIKPEDVDDPEKLAKELNKMRESIGWAQTNFEAVAGAIGQPNSRRVYIPTEEATTSTSYTTLTTEDKVMNVGLSNGGYIAVLYQALWKESVDGAARAAIFLDSNQLKELVLNGAPVEQEARIDPASGTNFYIGLSSSGAGLGRSGTSGSSLTADSSTVNTGLIVSTGTVGGPCYIWADPGTYTVTVRYKASSGTVTVKDRRLAAWTEGV